MQTGADNLSRIQGQIERITFANEENGFTIPRLKTKGEKILPPLGSSTWDLSKASCKTLLSLNRLIQVTKSKEMTRPSDDLKEGIILTFPSFVGSISSRSKAGNGSGDK